MARILRGAAFLLAITLAATYLVPAADAKQPAAEALPKVKPCHFYATDNETYPNTCGTNDAFTVALKRNQIKSTYGKLLYDDILTNIKCEETLTDQAGCLAPANPYKCVWVSGYCQSNSYVTYYKMACDGSQAKMFYECLARYQSEATCNNSPNCAWAPELAKYNKDGEQNSCYLKEVAKMTGEQLDDWMLTKGPNNVDQKFYDSYWGKCAAAKAHFDSASYVATCTSITDKATCDAKVCEWSRPYYENKCRPNRSRNYALQLAGAGYIREQFMQCFQIALAEKGETACNNYTLA